MTTRLLIARHGNTFGPGDVVTRVGARTDLPLVESGQAQGRKLGAFLREAGLVPAKVFTSRLMRTRQTADAIEEALGRALPREALAAFDEIDYGPDENVAESEVVRRLGREALEAWEERSVVPPGWQVDVAALQERWRAFGREVLTRFRGEAVLVVTSGGIARFAPALVGELATFYREHRPKVATGALCVFEADADVWRCTRWNERP